MGRKKDHQFHFKQFSVRHDRSGMKVGTDGVLLGAWVDVQEATRVLDIGTGTGVIALMIAQRTKPSTQIEAIEIDAHAFDDASENFTSSPWRDRLTLHHGPAQEFKHDQSFDLIVSNPPFFISSFKPPDSKRVTARHTEDLSFPEIIEIAEKLLSEKGKLNVVLPPAESILFIDLAGRSGFFCSRKWTFKSREEKPVERLLLEFSRAQSSIEEGEILLYSAGEEWSDHYKTLTREFYLKL